MCTFLFGIMYDNDDEKIYTQITDIKITEKTSAHALNEFQALTNAPGELKWKKSEWIKVKILIINNIHFI